jgi:hypothetical protein
MTLPGLLIEYLINGATALVWLAPLLASHGIDVFQSGTLPFLIVGLYVFGMVIDFLAYWLVRPLKNVVRKRAWLKHGNGDPQPAGKSMEREIQFSLYAPEIAKEVAMRSSRDRVARGAIANSILALFLEHVFHINPQTLPVFAWVSIVVIFVLMWWVFQGLSYGYEFRAAVALDAKKQDK